MSPASVATRSGATIDLKEVLASRRWLEVGYPFPHVVARNVFQQEFYQQLEESFLAVLARGFTETPNRRQFARIYRGYDAYGVCIPDEPDNPLRIFLTRAWHDMLAGVFGVDATGDVDSAMHHHRAGSAHGTIHNDLSPGYFAGSAGPDRVNLSDEDVCSYKFGAKEGSDVPVRATVRAVAMLFYLANPPWRHGDGGETGLYESESDPADRPGRAVPPLNNSVLLFRCTPYSYHSFISNRRRPRNSVIMWIHEPIEAVTGRWGEQVIVPW